MLQFLLYKALTKPNQRILCCRKFYADTKDSIYNVFILILKQWNIYDKCKTNDTERRITFPNGSFIFCRGLDDIEKLKSLVVSDIFVEEATQCTLADYQQLVLRLRGTQAVDGKIYLLFNPVSKTNWVYERFFEKTYEGERIELIHSTYKNNKFLSEKDIRQIENYKEIDYNYYKIYACGEFGNLNTDGLFYNDFNVDRNCADNKYNPNLPLHISFDDNITPYISLIISQIYKEGDKYIVKVIKNYAMFGKNLYTVLNQFKIDFINHQAGIFLYGDSSSNKRSTLLEENQNFYSIILQELAMFHPEKRVISSNQTVMISRMFMNRIFRKNDPKIEVIIDYSCKELINDLENLKVTPDGGKDKTIYNDKSRGMKYEKHGHQSDALSYLVIQAFYKDFTNFKLGASKDFKIGGALRKERGY